MKLSAHEITNIYVHWSYFYSQDGHSSEMQSREFTHEHSRLDGGPFFERAAGRRRNRRDRRDFGTCHDKRLDLSDVRGTARHGRCPELHFNLARTRGERGTGIPKPLTRLSRRTRRPVCRVRAAKSECWFCWDETFRSDWISEGGERKSTGRGNATLFPIGVSIEPKITMQMRSGRGNTFAKKQDVFFALRAAREPRSSARTDGQMFHLWDKRAHDVPKILIPR